MFDEKIILESEFKDEGKQTFEFKVPKTIRTLSITKEDIRFVQKHAQYIVARLKSIYGHVTYIDSKDVSQEAICKILESNSNTPLKGNQSREKYLAKVVKNTAISLIARTHKFSPTSEIPRPEIPAPALDANFHELKNINTLIKKRNFLTKRERQLWDLLYLECPLEEMLNRLSITKRTFQNMKSKIHIKIRNHISRTEIL